MAPEIFTYASLPKEDRPAYGHKVDIWSVGVVLYFMFCELYPFDNEDETQYSTLTFKNRMKWSRVTATAKILIRKMLRKDADKRCTIADVLADKWFDDDQSIRTLKGQLK